MAGWSSDVYVCVRDVEFWVYIAEYSLVGLDDPLEININKEIVRVNVLFDETFHFQECWKEVPFILDMVRPVAAAVSIFQIMGNTPSGRIEINSTQARISFRF